MLSIGDLVDKLVIENKKIFETREKMHSDDLDDKEYVELNNKMNLMNQNRTTLIILLDDKIEKVVSGKEKNSVLKVIKTYKVDNEI